MIAAVLVNVATQLAAFLGAHLARRTGLAWRLLLATLQRLSRFGGIAGGALCAPERTRLLSRGGAIFFKLLFGVPL